MGSIAYVMLHQKIRVQFVQRQRAETMVDFAREAPSPLLLGL